MKNNLLQLTQADGFELTVGDRSQLTDENLHELTEGKWFRLSEINPFQPDLYVSLDQHGWARFVAALLFVLFFVITVPGWLWCMNRLGRVLAITWLVGLVYLSYGLYINVRVNLAVPQPLNAMVLPPAAAEDTTLSPEITLPTVTPTPKSERVAAALSPIPLPTPTYTPMPLPTVTPWINNPRWAVVTQGRLNMRASQAADAEIVGKLVTGSCVEIITIEAGWLEVRQSTGEQGWSARQFLEFVPICPP